MREAEHFLHGFFWPKSIAVVGATKNIYKTNFRLVQNLVHLNYPGQIYPVNPTEKEILGLKAYARLEDIPAPIDLVVSGVRPELTRKVVEQCAVIGIKRLVIVTGGFSEAGQSGQALHREIAELVKSKGIRTLGPNTLTPNNTANNLIISYCRVNQLRQGGLSFAFQSGFYEPKINWIFSNFGVCKMLDMGNKIDIHEVEALEYFYLDPETRVIALHMESLHGDGRRFMELLREVSLKKPTVILKSGRTPSGSKAAASHTGSLARENDLIFDSLIKQTAAVRAQNLEEFFDLAKAFSYLELPRGKRLAILTMSGGEGVMATDAAEMSGLALASLNHQTLKKLKGNLPPWEIPLNPFDGGVVMQFNFTNLPEYFSSLAFIPADDNVDCAVMQMPPNMADFVFSGANLSADEAQSLRNKFLQSFMDIKNAGKPFVLWRSALDAGEGELIDLFEAHGLPVFASADRAVKALAVMAEYQKRRIAAEKGGD